MTCLLGRCRFLGRSLVSCQPSRCWCCCTMPKRSPAKRDFRDNGERKIKKSKEGASSSTSNVDEDLVRSFCLFSVMAPLFPYGGPQLSHQIQIAHIKYKLLTSKTRLNGQRSENENYVQFSLGLDPTAILVLHVVLWSRRDVLQRLRQKC